MIKFKQSKIKQTTFLDSQSIFDQLIPKDHVFRKIKKYMDFSFVDKELEVLYSEEGQHAISPSLLLKVSWLQYYYGGLSDRKIMNRANTDIAIKYFLDYRIDERLFHFSALERFRTAVGPDRLEKIFNRLNKQIKKTGIFSNRDVRYMDATHQFADVAKTSVLSLLERACERLLTCLWDYENVELKLEYDFGVLEIYLSEDKKKERVLHLIKYAQELMKLAKKVLDSNDPTTNKYAKLQQAFIDVKRIFRERTSRTKESNIKRENNKNFTGKLASLTDKDATWGSKSKKMQFLGFKINTTFTDTEFIDYVSVHQGHVQDQQMYPKDINAIKRLDSKVIRVVTDKKYGTLANRIYSYLSNITLIALPYKNMKAHLSSEIMDEAFLTQFEKKAIDDLKHRGHLEGKFGEMKTQHHFHRAKYRSLKKVKFQAIMTAMVVNLKRFATIIAT